MTCKDQGEDGLELVWSLLPATVTLDPYPDASKDHLLSAAEIDTQLDDIAVSNRIQPGLHVGLTQAHSVQEGPRRAPYIFDIPLSVGVGKLAVFPADHLRLESDGGV